MTSISISQRAPRRSPRKKNVSPETATDSGDEAFVPIEAEDRYHFFFFFNLILPIFFGLVFGSLDGKDDVDMFQGTDEEVTFDTKVHAQNSGTAVKTVNKRPIVISDSEDDRLVPTLRCYHSTNLISCSDNITPPPTPSPVKAGNSKKRAIGNSDEEDVFIPRYSFYTSFFSIFF